jgi:flagellar FliJ protein
MPATFRFSLEPLLDWRARIEEEKQRDFAACRRLLAECARELERLTGVHRECARQLAASVRANRVADLRLRDAHLRCLEAANAKERVRRTELQAACDRARAELIAASGERRVVEKLKERRRREFEAEALRRDEIELDESNARRHERAVRERLARRRVRKCGP